MGSRAVRFIYAVLINVGDFQLKVATYWSLTVVAPIISKPDQSKLNLCVVGAQWGDEGKGKIVDLLTPPFDIVVRYQGGHNAGHTVRIGNQKYILHLLPSAVLHKGKTCVIGNGVVIDPRALLKEIDDLKQLDVTVGSNLHISSSAHLILSYHGEWEQGSEALRGDRKIGTTCRGIGPCYEDKYGRRGIRIGDLLNPEFFRRLVAENVAEKSKFFPSLYHFEARAPEAYAEEILSCAERVIPFITNVPELLAERMRNGSSILFEGAQGSLLDIDHGTYPYVTSSNCVAGGAATGAGVPPHVLHRILGVTKAYCTRVGQGPFPTALSGAIEEDIRQRGQEFGASTGRPRRCGWIDLPALHHAAILNGFHSLALMKLDILSYFDEIQVCTGYRYKNSIIKEFPSEVWKLEECRPVYVTRKGWKTQIGGFRSFEELPIQAREFVLRLEDDLQLPFGIISTGSERHETIFCKGKGIDEFIS